MPGVRFGQEDLLAAGMTVAEPITLAEGPGSTGEYDIIEESEVSTIWKNLYRRALYTHTNQAKVKIMALFRWKWMQNLDD